NVVGEHDDLERFAEYAGHRARVFDETDLISLGVGIAAGVALGTMDISLAGKSFSLGLSGGPLLAALLLAHLGHVGPIQGHLPRASRLLLTEIGLVLLLADAGIRAGAALGGVITQYGPTLCIASVLVVIVPMVVGALLAQFVWKLPLLQILGGICGGMTSTPGIGAVTSQTESDVPVVSYAAAYPVALIMMTIFVRLLLSLLA
ncbi:MAG TPA: YidE/YbjL duplication, partial [Phycisphaerae bacterium]|nr:YidE/YbjL duplication [Phycisphaerae bacterium]